MSLYLHAVSALLKKERDLLVRPQRFDEPFLVEFVDNAGIEEIVRVSGFCAWIGLGKVGKLGLNARLGKRTVLIDGLISFVVTRRQHFRVGDAGVFLQNLHGVFLAAIHLTNAFEIAHSKSFQFRTEFVVQRRLHYIGTLVLNRDPEFRQLGS